MKSWHEERGGDGMKCRRCGTSVAVRFIRYVHCVNFRRGAARARTGCGPGGERGRMCGGISGHVWANIDGLGLGAPGRAFRHLWLKGSRVPALRATSSALCSGRTLSARWGRWGQALCWISKGAASIEGRIRRSSPAERRELQRPSACERVRCPMIISGEFIDTKFSTGLQALHAASSAGGACAKPRLACRWSGGWSVPLRPGARGDGERVWDGLRASTRSASIDGNSPAGDWPGHVPAAVRQP
ncbi:hypothetical protein C8Q78DRAFT_143349 [Trametes maxima]|nr:hypothetical protein C8Q78DRAFT_143349 [Trametes maxima]